MNDRELEQALRLGSHDLERLRLYESLVLKWSRVINLVSASAQKDLWRRHILDSVQVQRAVPKARTWVDIGSGGGFPGMITALLLGERGSVHLVESDGRKCGFLRAVSRETGVRVEVHHGRIEDVLPDLPKMDAISARALARLRQLVDWAEPAINKGAVGVFLKGKDAAIELTEIPSKGNFHVERRPSLTDSQGCLVLIRSSQVGAPS